MRQHKWLHPVTPCDARSQGIWWSHVTQGHMTRGKAMVTEIVSLKRYVKLYMCSRSPDSKDPIHGVLEYCWCVGHSKEHYLWSVGAFWQFERQFPLILRLYTYVVIPVSDVQGCEQNLPIQLLQYLFYVRHGIYVPFCPTVHGSVVLYGSEGTILLFDKEKGGSPWGVDLLDVS